MPGCGPKKKTPLRLEKLIKNCYSVLSYTKYKRYPSMKLNSESSVTLTTKNRRFRYDSARIAGNYAMISKASVPESDFVVEGIP